MTLPLTALRSVAAVDARLVARDRFLAWMMGFILATSVIFRFAFPAAAGALRARYGFDLETYYPLLASFVVINLGAPLMGMIMGFLLVEAREDNTLKALMVSPVSFDGYLGYKAVAPILLGFVTAPLVAFIVGVGLPPTGPLLLICVVASVMAGVTAFVIAVFSDNKVQAFAVLKIAGASGWIPLVAWFVPEPWQYIAGVLPTYWVFKAYWLAVEARALWIPALAAGAITLSVALRLLMNRFQTVARR